MYIPSCDEEKEYLEAYNPNEYKKPCVTVDFIVQVEDSILLIQRKNYPYKNYWALPGGFLDVGKENTLQAVIRELKEETNLDITPNNCKLLGVYSDVNRDPRDHVVSIVYYVKLYKIQATNMKASDDATNAFLFDNEHIQDLVDSHKIAFDHATILKDYTNLLKMSK